VTESRRYDSPLRRERAAETRDRIVQAGADLAREQSSWDWRTVTLRAVAERAGVHERTVYRHFATEQDLRSAVLQRLEQEAGTTLEGLAMADLPEHVSQVFRYLSSFTASTRASSDASFAAIDRRRKQAILAAVTAESPGWDDRDRRTAAAMIDVLWGLPTFQRLVTAWGLDTDDAARGTTWVIGLIGAAIQNGPGPQSSVDRSSN
jgi:AcrR family transcriptional regulator